MKLTEYIKDQWLSFTSFILLIILIVFVLLPFKIESYLIIIILTLMILQFLIYHIYEFTRKKAFYNEFSSKLNSLESKYFITEMVSKPNFFDGAFLHDSLYEIDKSMKEQLNAYGENLADFKDFIELWIHEVKLPLSSIVLMIHNHKNEMDQKLLEQVKKLENYVDQVLYYVRSENSEKDYLIKSCYLDKIINHIAIKNKDSLLYHNVQLQTENLHLQVHTDSKWLEFIVNQILNNSLKYRNEKDAQIRISAIENADTITLKIYDNGIGISASDLPRVFDKSFTGENGRTGSSSTGMGLYICRNLCEKLGHKIMIHSNQGEYTEVSIIFSKNPFYEVIK